MAIEIKLLGLVAKGLRCPDYEINLESLNQFIYPVTLIQMPNGTGKTTTLELLRTTLSGKAENEIWNLQKILSFRKKNQENSKGYFEVKLDINKKKVTITLSFDFDEGTIEYYTTSNNGKEKGFKLPREVRDYLNPDFIEFLVFDGELAQQLLDSTYTDAEKVIESLYKIKYFKSIQNVIDAHWQDTMKNTTATDNKGLTRRENKVNNLTDRISLLKMQKTEAEKNLKRVTEEYEQINNKYDEILKKNDNIQHDYERTKEELKAIGRDFEIQTKQLILKIRSPYFLSETIGKDLLEFKQKLDKAKLPESTAREFFEEIANCDECICGRELHSEHKKEIINRAKLYMGSNEMGFLNAIKSEINQHFINTPEQCKDEFVEHINVYKKTLLHKNKVASELDAIEHNLTNGDSSILDIRKKRDSLRNEISQLEEEISKYESKDDTLEDDRTFGILLLEERLKSAEIKLAEITDTVELKNKINVIKNIISDSFTLAMKEIIESTVKEANDRIKVLIPNNDIQIEKIEKALKLKGQEGGSVGETLTVAYAFMSTIFNATERNLPFIVDSPANSIDKKVRKEVAKLIPKVSNQFIAFTMSSETTNFVKPLDEAANGAVNYVTIFRKGDTYTESNVAESENCYYTDDACIVYGKNFYMNFQTEEE